MLLTTIAADAPLGQAIGIKEKLAQYLENFGDSRMVSVEKLAPEQLKIE